MQSLFTLHQMFDLTKSVKQIGLLWPFCNQTDIRTPLEDREHLDNHCVHLYVGFPSQCISSLRRINLLSTNDDDTVENLPEPFACSSHPSLYHLTPRSFGTCAHQIVKMGTEFADFHDWFELESDISHKEYDDQISAPAQDRCIP